ncbi:MAG TPA: amidohydrolase family protein [Polyangiaceae bacterium]|jgi:cytosine deaminase|nr:amidohydrolase family protein [Polyangiaceae bacterium]
MLIERLVAAHIDGDVCALELAQGRVTRVARESVVHAGGATTFSAGGRVVTPAFVDAHVHLDKAFLAAEAGPTEARLGAAIASVGALRGKLTAEKTRTHAERAVALLVKNGVTAARVHAEIDEDVGLDLVHLQQAMAEEVASRIELQLVAFPQRGLERSGMTELMAAAMSEGVPVVGGCPYVDADPANHLDFVFGLAERHGAPVDLHLDFSDDPGASLLGLVAERTRAHGMQGRVTIGHVTTLAAMNADAQSAALDVLAACDIAIVVLPATDLYLAGHGEPGTRSLAPLERARRAGVRVAIANNNIQNPFARFGNGNLVQAAWLAGITRRAADAVAQRYLYEAITSEPSRILGLAPHGPTAGALAHLAILDAEREDDIVVLSPPVLATIRAGNLVHALGDGVAVGPLNKCQ